MSRRIMMFPIVTRQKRSTAWPVADFERDVETNALSVDELFALYRRAGFLYPAKAARLAPHLDVVQDNWARLLEAGDALLYVLTAGDDAQGRASVAVWRTSRHGWVWQHLVGEGTPLRSRAVMLGGLRRCIRFGMGRAQQNWFRPDNRFPARVFGSMVGTIGDSLSSVTTHTYFAVPRGRARQDVDGVRVVACDGSRIDALCDLAARCRGAVYVTAEELGHDLELEAVDRLYQAVGLRRTRQVWLAYRTGENAPVGAALAYRGPLGVNFSFLENRCDLLLAPGLSAQQATDVTAALMARAADAYDRFELEEIPVVADSASAAALVACGGQMLRSYCQGIWLERGQPALYRHVDRFYTRLLHRADRRSVSTKLAV
jgi:hypothetical protein